MRTRMVRSGEIELHVIEDGNPAHPSVLFLHGFPDCHKVWEKQFRALARDHHVIAFDLRGCGNSSAPSRREGFRIDSILPDIDAVITATCGDKGRVHLVGHDWGSVLGWSFVAHPTYNTRVLSWTSMSGPHVGLMWQWLFRKATSFRRDDMVAALEQFAHSWYIFALNIPGAGRALFRFAGVEIWKRALQEGGVSPNDPYLDVTQDEVERITLNTIGLYQQNAFRPPAAPAPGSIRLPTQLIVPVNDQFVRPGLFDYLDEVCTNLTRVTLDANHWAQRSNPDDVSALIRGFVARVVRDTMPAPAAAPKSAATKKSADPAPAKSTVKAAQKSAPKATEKAKTTSTSKATRGKKNA